MKKSLVFGLTFLFLLGSIYFVSADLNNQLISQNIGNWVFINGSTQNIADQVSGFKIISEYRGSYLLDNESFIPSSGLVDPQLLGSPEGATIDIIETDSTPNRASLEGYLKALSSGSKVKFDVENIDGNNIFYRKSSSHALDLQATLWDEKNNPSQSNKYFNITIETYSWYSGKTIAYLTITKADSDNRDYTSATSDFLDNYLTKYPSDISNGLLQRIFSWFRNLFG